MSPTQSPAQPTHPAQQWHIEEPSPEDQVEIQSLARQHRLGPLMAQLLWMRGQTEPGAFLNPRLDALHAPEGLPDMAAARARLSTAISEKQCILVHGDYDVDGVTGTAILVRLLRLVGANVHWYIPNRLKDGYSFGDHSVDHARKLGAQLVISVDNGTSASETIAKLNEHGIETMVTDHHEAPASGELPAACAIVNPKLDSSEYPFRELCGSGVAFKLAWGVCQELSQADKVKPELKKFLVETMSFVALATVCDVVPLVDENRILAHFGLMALERSPSAGLQALLKVAKLTGRRLNAEDVGFQIGPRLNAAGRLGRADLAVELLLCEDPAEATSLANELNDLNLRRRQIEKDILEMAIVQAETFADPAEHPVLVLAGEGWHQGVVGIVAARIAEKYNRPALIIGIEDGLGRGSARSVDGVSILEIMHAGSDHMQRYGGHAAAAGCEIDPDKVELLRASLRERAKEVLGQGKVKAATLRADTTLTLDTVNAALMSQLQTLEPFGEANPEPIFHAEGLFLTEAPRLMGAEGKHLSLRLRCGEASFRAVAFGLGERAGELELGRPLEILFTPRWNLFRGERNLELFLKDFRS